MKQFILIAIIIASLFGFTLILFGCAERKEVYETQIKTYVISSMQEHGSNMMNTEHYIYFHSLTSTEKAKVNRETYEKYKVGDTIQVLIKYWEKSKK